ncbi:MAG TPA: pitrilysin family protein [Longimicrobiaceae bacterium]|nr:pitrilysin family protein [Longimicrobiaceae bacterium]
MKPPLLAALLAAFPLALSAQETVRLDYVQDTLPNGLKVVYHVDRSSPVAATMLWYDVGSRHEQPGRTGFAHLFEHLMLFTGSRNVPEGQHFAMLEAAGGRAGADINGTTSNDRTNYFQQVPSNMVELALWLEADRMATLDEVLNQAKLDNQREVVKNERRQGLDNQPYGRWLERMLANAFPEGHPYRHPVIGSLEDLENARLEEVREFFRTYYVPNNAVLAVAGDIDVEATREMVRRFFGPIPRGAEPPARPDAAVPPRIGAPVREAIEDANAPAPAVYVGYRVPNARDPRAAAVSVLSGYLADGRTSPLYQALVQRQQVAANVFSFNFEIADGADLLVVGAVGKPGGDPAALERALLAEMEGIGARIDAAGLRRVQAAARFGLVNQLQSMGGFGGRSDVLAEGWTIHGDPGWINRRLPAIDAVTVDGLRALAAERLAPENRVTLVFTPARPATPTPARP